jgi:hypothetical protein
LFGLIFNSRVTEQHLLLVARKEQKRVVISTYDVSRCGIDDACVDYIVRRKQLSVLGILGSGINSIRRNCTEVQGFAVREQSAYRISHHRSSLFTLVGGIGHSVLVDDSDLVRIHRNGISADKQLQVLPCLLA